MPPLQTGADSVAKGAHVVRNSCFYDMAAPAARPYDSVSLKLNGRAVRVEARDHMPLLRPLRDILGSGEIQFGHRDQVKTEIERRESPVVLDLKELNLIDLEGVRFLNACEANGISVLHCSPCIREWVLQERGRPKPQPEP
jgi:hypothetical protein